MSERKLPHDTEAEAAVLGSVMLDNNAIKTLTLQPEHFYRERHQVLFEAMQLLASEGEPIDTVTMSRCLKDHGNAKMAGGGGYLVELSLKTPASLSIDHYAKIIAKTHNLRRIIEFGRKAIIGAMGDPWEVDRFVNDLQAELSALCQQSTATSYCGMREMMADLGRYLIGILEKTEPIALSTGFRDLDRKLKGGVRNDELIVIAGRPSMGKTALALNIVYQVAVKKRGVSGIFSLEMPHIQLAMRLLQLKLEKTSDELEDRSQLSRISDQVLKLIGKMSEEMKIFVDDMGNLDILEVCARARKMHQQEQLSLLVVDYLQLMKGTAKSSRENRQVEVSEISRSLKLLARELGIPVIAVSQLNRAVEQRADKHPTIADLRESGSIEQDADKILLLYREEYYNKHCDVMKRGIVEVDVAKHRNGPTGVVKLMFKAEWMKVKDLARRVDPEDCPL